MAANFPGAAPSFTTKSAGQSIQAAHINGAQDEIVAIGTWLLSQTFTSYTPTWTNATLGNGTLTGKYFKIGKFVFFRIDVLWGSTTSSAGSWAFTVPVSQVIPSALTVGIGEAIDISSGQAWIVRARATAATTFAPLTGDGAAMAGITGAAPFAWATGDEFHVSGFYEAA